MTVDELARSRKSWADIQQITTPASQAMAVVFWASTWAEKLLAAAAQQPPWDERSIELPPPPPLMTTGEDDCHGSMDR